MSCIEVVVACFSFCFFPRLQHIPLPTHCPNLNLTKFNRHRAMGVGIWESVRRRVMEAGTVLVLQ